MAERKIIDLNDETCRAALAVWDSAKGASVLSKLPVRFRGLPVDVWCQDYRVAWIRLGIIRAAVTEYVHARGGDLPFLDRRRQWVVYFGEICCPTFDAALLVLVECLLVDEKPAEAPVPDRTGQWWASKAGLDAIHIVGSPSPSGDHPCNVHNALSGWVNLTVCRSIDFGESCLTRSGWRRVPPMPSCPAGWRFVAVRAPKNAEWFLTYPGTVLRQRTEGQQVGEIEDCGPRRWIVERDAATGAPTAPDRPGPADMVALRLAVATLQQRVAALEAAGGKA